MGSCFIVVLAFGGWRRRGRSRPSARRGSLVTSDLVLKMYRLPQEQRGARLQNLLPPAGAGSVGGDPWRHKRIRDLSITKEEKEALLLYFSDKQGLAPAEVAPYAYTLEKRDTKEKVDSQVVIDMCVRCHSYAKTALQRRTPEDWTKLANMHSGVLPMWLISSKMSSTGTTRWPPA